MFVSTRWLTVYDITISTIYMFDVYVVLYFSFLNKQDKKLYQSRFNGIYSRHEISEESKARIEASQNVLSKKRLTKEGKERKERILEKLFIIKKKTRLYLSVYSSSLQLMKRYVKIFQQAKPAVFRIHGEQLDIFEEYLINFIKPEVLGTNN